MRLFIRKDQVRQGPHSLETISSMLINGSLRPTDLARSDESSPWTALASIPELGINLPLHPRPSRLAIWSMILGIGGIMGFFIFLMPPLLAITLGHQALRTIRKSDGALTGRGMGWTGLILGYLGLVMLAGTVTAVKYFTRKREQNSNDRHNILLIEMAVDSYYEEYGKLPTEMDFINTSKDNTLAKTLLGIDTLRNTKSIRFLTIKETKTNKNGLDPTSSLIFDAWGRGYLFIPDTGGKKEIIFNRGMRKETVRYQRVAIYGQGEDGIPGTKDDVQNW
jgi:type II secretory pathway pseudopilin PulG